MTQPVPGSWPFDEDGKPMVLISIGASEKIGLPHYSNVDIGPASVTRFVKDVDEEIKQGLSDSILLVEEVIGSERAAVLEIVKRDVEAARSKP